MSPAPRPELAAVLELAAVCTILRPIAAAVVLAGVLLVELELGDRRADVGRAEAELAAVLQLVGTTAAAELALASCSTAPPRPRRAPRRPGAQAPRRPIRSPRPPSPPNLALALACVRGALVLARFAAPTAAAPRPSSRSRAVRGALVEHELAAVCTSPPIRLPRPPSPPTPAPPLHLDRVERPGAPTLGPFAASTVAAQPNSRSRAFAAPWSSSPAPKLALASCPTSTESSAQAPRRLAADRRRGRARRRALWSSSSSAIARADVGRAAARARRGSARRCSWSSSSSATAALMSARRGPSSRSRPAPPRRAPRRPDAQAPKRSDARARRRPRRGPSSPRTSSSARSTSPRRRSPPRSCSATAR